MKSVVSAKSCNQPLPFPKLMKLDESGQVVLFTNKVTGTVVTQGYWPIGTYKEEWVPERFKDFNGSVCLENDK